jgi:hypothetical protein
MKQTFIRKTHPNFLSHRILISICLLVVIMILIRIVGQYQRYVYAQVWHWRYGSIEKIGDYEIDIPERWWPEQENRSTRILLSRACKNADFLEPKMEIKPVSPGGDIENDAEESRLVHTVISNMSRDPQSGWSFSAVNLQAKKSLWYCIKSEQTILGRTVFTSLSCNASKISYSIDYKGPPEQQREAELIIRSFR